MLSTQVKALAAAISSTILFFSPASNASLQPMIWEKIYYEKLRNMKRGRTLIQGGDNKNDEVQTKFQAISLVLLIIVFSDTTLADRLEMLICKILN